MKHTEHFLPCVICGDHVFHTVRDTSDGRRYKTKTGTRQGETLVVLQCPFCHNVVIEWNTKLTT